MNRIDCNRTAGIGRQTGTTLILALVLLLLATLLTLFAMNVGIFAQRSSAADLRARVIHQTLEAALSQGIEYIKNNRTTLIASMLATPCDASADPPTFPCGTVPKCASGAVSGTGCSDPALARRGNMFYYFNSAGPGYDVNGNGGSADALDKASLPIGASRMTSASNGFTVNYGVGAVMCMVKKPTNATDPTECTVNTNNAQGTYLFTVTAVGNISGESAGSTLSTTFGTSPVAPGAGSAPTITASGTVDLNGNGTFVTNPNAAGNGMPVTVWSPQCVNTQGSGTVNTCYLEDWLRASSGTFTYATNSDGTTSNVPVCAGNGNNACSCSSSISSGPGSLTEGIDILTNDTRGTCTGSAPNVLGTGADCTKVNCRANYNVDETEFPCDLFQYIFGISSWEDDAVQSPGTQNAACTAGTASGGGDCFCEKHKSTSFTVADGSSQTMGPDEAYLYSKSAYIYSTAHPTWVTAAQTATSCSDLITKGSATGGLLWDQTGGCLKSASQIGYPDKPVILVADGTADLQGAIMYGIMFIRDTTAAGSSTSYGGTANFVGHSTGTIYGAMVVQGTASKINGTSAIVYNGNILTALAAENPLNPAGPVPGSWTDRYAY
jgi:Tfp pilus assembly protein PilX